MRFLFRLICLKKTAILVLILFLFYVLWILFLSDDHHDKWYEGKAPCKMPDKVYEDMAELAFRIHETLDKLNIPHFLCYGSLWGAIRISRILPWDNNVNFCVMNEDVVQVDEALVYTTFHRSKIRITYDARHGVYNLKYKSAVGDITVFQKFFGQMQRAGWEIRLLPFMYTYQHEFPPRLVQKPFPTRRFLGAEFPVPHEEIEILKYLYPDNWWKEVKPQGC